MVFVWENIEGEYVGVGGCIRVDIFEEIVVQVSIFTWKNIEWLICYSFELVKVRVESWKKLGRKIFVKVTSVIKFNALNFSMVFWDEIFFKILVEYSDIIIDQYYVDVMVMYMIQCFEDFDVVVASNLFGDILIDLGGVF